MTEQIPLNPQQLDDEKVVLLQTRKRDGSWVDTAVNIAVQGDRAYFRTYGKASKNKRLRNFPEVQIRPCTWSGKPTGGPTMTAHARLLYGEESEAAGRLIDRKYPLLQHRLVHLAHKIMRTPTLHYELSP
ncbi:MAG: PPOX class F420-dependent oxidoreductase [Candidatus Sericytochromatia bacterium]